MSDDQVNRFEEILQYRREKESDERVTRLAAKIGRDPHAAALRMRELEIALSLAAGSLENHGDHPEAGLSRGILSDDPAGEWGEDLGRT